MPRSPAAIAAQKRWNARNWEKIRDIRRRYERLPEQKALKHIRDRRKLLKRYNLTVEQFDAMYEAQERRCGVCAYEFDRTKQGQFYPHIDHDHATGIVRGLLCSRCNTALGLLRDNPAILTLARLYLLNYARRLAELAGGG